MAVANGKATVDDDDHHVELETDDTPTTVALLHPNDAPLEERVAEARLMFLCFDLSLISPLYRFWLLTAGLFFFFMANSYVEEYTFKRLPKFEFGWYLTLFELVSFVVFGCLDRKLNTGEALFQHNAPLSEHGIVAIAMFAARGLTNVSLQYLNYPTQIIFKSMKLITVMIGSFFILGKRYHLYECVSALLLVVSASLFSLGDVDATALMGNSAQSVMSVGIIIVLASLVADAVHSTTQDRVLNTFRATPSEVMLFTNGIAAVISLVFVLFKGELMPALKYCSDNPAAYVLFTLRSVTIYLGVQSFLLFIKAFGVVMATGATTVRKIASIALSFLIFPKVFSMKYVWGVVVLALSAIIQEYGRYSISRGSALPHGRTR